MNKERITQTILVAIILMGVYLSHWFFTVPAVVVLGAVVINAVSDLIKKGGSND